jgi:hypothetical protein
MQRIINKLVHKIKVLLKLSKKKTFNNSIEILLKLQCLLIKFINKIPIRLIRSIKIKIRK